ncbi:MULTISPECIES: uracil-DNA glycosylase [unclassified Thioalkalivibrio]|uniref:uracil-DNA glycosylase n=1 Tax=unclassified Thioalkalivibrio TaxID=2621013 RepID=UPI00038118E3|nr:MULTISPECIES: uracil-DNA glycosylase [unclassified Thioalkalivibrio]
MPPEPGAIFRADCRACPRLAAFLEEVRDKHADYHAAPVPSFGPLDARLLIVGLAPGMHGANATGRPFTGDYAGVLLYETLHEHGFASAPESTRADDGLELIDCRITNAVKCLPPQNKPTTEEIRTCNGFLAAEMTAVRPRVILALGKIAHDAILRAKGLPLSSLRFAHGAEHELDANTRLIDSYHCSRYNTQTRRLTPAMFHELFARVRSHLG